MSSAHRLSYASALSSPPPKNHSRPIKRLPAVFSRRGRSSRSSGAPTITIGAPQIEQAKTSPTPSSADQKELESQPEGLRIQPHSRSRPINPTPSLSGPIPDHGVWKELETEIEVFKFRTKRTSRFSGFFASSDYQKKLEMTEKMAKIRKTPAESPELFSGIFAWQDDCERLVESLHNSELVKSCTAGMDPCYESPTILKQVVELVTTPTKSPTSFPALFLSDSNNGSLVGDLNGGGDALHVAGVSTGFSVLVDERQLSAYMHRHSGSMSSIDDDDNAYMPLHLTSAVPTAHLLGSTHSEALGDRIQS